MKKTERIFRESLLKAVRILRMLRMMALITRWWTLFITQRTVHPQQRHMKLIF